MSMKLHSLVGGPTNDKHSAISRLISSEDAVRIRDGHDKDGLATIEGDGFVAMLRPSFGGVVHVDIIEGLK